LSPDGTTDRLAVGGSPAWSPDGTQITYIRASYFGHASAAR
jgi:hypothetical protein